MGLNLGEVYSCRGYRDKPKDGSLYNEGFEPPPVPPLTINMKKKKLRHKPRVGILCKDPEHFPPTYKKMPIGRYAHTCPTCKNLEIFEVVDAR